MATSLEEWEPVRDANGKFLFEVNILNGHVRTKRNGLTTVVDVEKVRRESLQRQSVALACERVVIDTRTGAN